MHHTNNDYKTEASLMAMDEDSYQNWRCFCSGNNPCLCIRFSFM